MYEKTWYNEAPPLAADMTVSDWSTRHMTAKLLVLGIGRTNAAYICDDIKVTSSSYQ